MIWSIIILIAANLVNVFIDAYKITKLNKNIRHGINFAVHGIVVGACMWIWHLNLWFILFAFCNRQLTFDIPLNLKRHLPWDYVTKERPPKAVMDRIEVRVFGYDGRTPIIFYSFGFIASLIMFLT